MKDKILLEKLEEVREHLDYVCEYEFPLTIFVRIDECIEILKAVPDENVYEVIGYPLSCPEETFSEGLYRSKESAEIAMQKAIEECDGCEFEIYVKRLYG